MTKLYAPSTNAVTQGWGAEFYSMNGDDYPNGVYRTLYGWPGHNGLDYSYGPDANVYAAADGTVVFADWGQNQAGKWFPAGGIVTMIDHGDCYTVYAHQYQNDTVRVGQKVKAGQVIGTIGATGMTAGAHLHFEVFPKNPNFANGWAGRLKPVLVSSKPATVSTASGATIKPIAPAKPAPREDDPMPLHKYFAGKNIKLKGDGKWRTLHDSKGGYSILGGDQARKTINDVKVNASGLPNGAELALRYVIVKYAKGKATKVHKTFDRIEIVGTNGTTQGQNTTMINLPKGSEYRIRIQAACYVDGVTITSFKNDTYYWKG